MSNTDDRKNQGEGDREAAQRYRQDAEQFARSKRGERATEEAANISEEELRESERAEEEALQRAKGEDPQVTRD